MSSNNHHRHHHHRHRRHPRRYRGPITIDYVLKRDQVTTEWPQIDLRLHGALVQGTFAKRRSTESVLSLTGQGLLRLIRGIVHVPFRWSRHVLIEKEDFKNSSTKVVYYCSPSGRVLRNLAEVKSYLKEPESCQCYLLSDALPLTDCFNFDPYVAGAQLPPPCRPVKTNCQKYIESFSENQQQGTTAIASERRRCLEKLFTSRATEDQDEIAALSSKQMSLTGKGNGIVADEDDNLNNFDAPSSSSEDEDEDEDYKSDNGSDEDFICENGSDDDHAGDENEAVDDEGEKDKTEEEDNVEEDVEKEENEDKNKQIKPEGPLDSWMRLFDWSQVVVLTDGKVYLRELHKNQWHHRLSEWKDTEDFSLQQAVAEAEAEAEAKNDQQPELLLLHREKMQSNVGTSVASAASSPQLKGKKSPVKTLVTSKERSNEKIASSSSSASTPTSSSTVSSLAAKGRKPSSGSGLKNSGSQNSTKNGSTDKDNAPAKRKSLPRKLFINDVYTDDDDDDNDDSAIEEEEKGTTGTSIRKVPASAKKAVKTKQAATEAKKSAETNNKKTASTTLKKSVQKNLSSSNAVVADSDSDSDSADSDLDSSFLFKPKRGRFTVQETDEEEEEDDDEPEQAEMQTLSARSSPAKTKPDVQIIKKKRRPRKRIVLK